MFTGIIERVGRLKSFNGERIEISCEENMISSYKTDSGDIDISCSEFLHDVNIGESIAVNGICLTVIDLAKNYFIADVMPETIRKTSLAELKRGGLVNLERALKLGDRLGGHIVSGHIDGVGKILSIRAEGNALLVEVSAESSLLKQIAPKGSVALDGISLTVVDACAEKFSVSMIPHTREVTNFKQKRSGSLVNIETDILAKYVERLMNFKATPAVTKTFLEENGFL